MKEYLKYPRDPEVYDLVWPSWDKTGDYTKTKDKRGGTQIFCVWYEGRVYRPTVWYNSSHKGVPPNSAILAAGGTAGYHGCTGPSIDTWTGTGSPPPRSKLTNLSGEPLRAWMLVPKHLWWDLGYWEAYQLEYTSPQTQITYAAPAGAGGSERTAYGWFPALAIQSKDLAFRGLIPTACHIVNRIKFVTDGSDTSFITPSPDTGGCLYKLVPDRWTKKERYQRDDILRKEGAKTVFDPEAVSHYTGLFQAKVDYAGVSQFMWDVSIDGNYPSIGAPGAEYIVGGGGGIPDIRLGVSINLWTQRVGQRVTYATSAAMPSSFEDYVENFTIDENQTFYLIANPTPGEALRPVIYSGNVFLGGGIWPYVEVSPALDSQGQPEPPVTTETATTNSARGTNWAFVATTHRFFLNRKITLIGTDFSYSWHTGNEGQSNFTAKSTPIFKEAVVKEANWHVAGATYGYNYSLYGGTEQPAKSLFLNKDNRTFILPYSSYSQSSQDGRSGSSTSKGSYMEYPSGLMDIEKD